MVRCIDHVTPEDAIACECGEPRTGVVLFETEAVGDLNGQHRALACHELDDGLAVYPRDGSAIFRTV